MSERIHITWLREPPLQHLSHPDAEHRSDSMYGCMPVKRHDQLWKLRQNQVAADRPESAVAAGPALGLRAYTSTGLPFSNAVVRMRLSTGICPSAAYKFVLGEVACTAYDIGRRVLMHCVLVGCMAVR